jgi:hypothetical protein
VPLLTSISPSSVAAGATDTTITLTGNYFDSGAVVYYNGGALATTHVSYTSLTAVIPTASLASAGTAVIWVANTNRSSASVVFTITAASTVTSISPTSVVAGAGDTTITITGTGFSNPEVAKANATSLTQVSFIGSTSFTAKILAAQLTAAGTLAITVVGSNGSVTFTIQASSTTFDDSSLLPTQFASQFALDTTKTVYNVKTGYSAVGDGVTDDTVPIRNAIAAAKANGSGIIYLPTGTYKCCPQAGDTGDAQGTGAQKGPYNVTISGTTVTGSSAATGFANSDNSGGSAKGQSVYFVNTGTLPQVSGVNVSTGVGNWYYVGNINTGAGTFNLYTTNANALANTSPITFSSAGSGVQLTFPPFGPVFMVNHSDLIFIGDGPTNTIIKGCTTGLLDPAANWVVTGSGYGRTARGILFFVDSHPAAVSGVQFRSLKLDGQCTTTGNSGSGGGAGGGYGNVLNGDGWDLYHKCINLNGTHLIDNTLIHNCDCFNWRGEILYSGGNLIGTAAIINCTLHGTNADAVSMSAGMTCANNTIGGPGVNDRCYNGFENQSYSGQVSVIQDCIIQIDPSPLNTINDHYGAVIQGRVGSTWTVQRNTFKCGGPGLYVSEACNTLLIDSNIFVDTYYAMFVSRLGLYGDMPAGWNDWTISNNQYSCTQATGALLIIEGIWPVHNCALSNNTVQGDASHACSVGGSGSQVPAGLAAWGTFTIDGSTINGLGGRDGGTNPNRALWTNTNRGGKRTAQKFDSFSRPGGDIYDITDYVNSDQCWINSNATPGGTHALAIIRSADLANFPTNFTVTFVTTASNWYLKADATWNTWVSDIPVVDGVTKIQYNGSKFVQLA